MKNHQLIFILVLSVVIFSGCLPGQTDQSGAGDPTAADNQTIVPAADQKSGDTTKTGTVSTAGGKYFLAEPGQPPREIESYSVDLAGYVGQTVTVTGQYSGDTLFVGRVD